MSKIDRQQWRKRFGLMTRPGFDKIERERTQRAMANLKIYDEVANWTMTQEAEQEDKEKREEDKEDKV